MTLALMRVLNSRAYFEENAQTRRDAYQVCGPRNIGLMGSPRSINSMTKYGTPSSVVLPSNILAMIRHDQSALRICRSFLKRRNQLRGRTGRCESI